MNGLSLDDYDEEVGGLSLDNEPAPGLALDLEDEPALMLEMRIRLKRDSPYFAMPDSLLLGKVIDGFKVVAIHDILPPTGDEWSRELDIQQQPAVALQLP